MLESREADDWEVISDILPGVRGAGMCPPLVPCVQVCIKTLAAKSVAESPHLSAFAEQADLLVCACVRVCVCVCVCVTHGGSSCAGQV